MSGGGVERRWFAVMWHQDLGQGPIPSNTHHAEQIFARPWASLTWRQPPPAKPLDKDAPSTGWAHYAKELPRRALPNMAGKNRGLLSCPLFSRYIYPSKACRARGKDRGAYTSVSAHSPQTSAVNVHQERHARRRRRSGRMHEHSCRSIEDKRRAARTRLRCYYSKVAHTLTCCFHTRHVSYSRPIEGRQVVWVGMGRYLSRHRRLPGGN